MHIEGVEFADFRNYHRLSFTPAPGLNILAGLNAQGKTNLLEGIAVLAVGRSFRGARPAELTRWGAGRATVSGALRQLDSGRDVRRVIGLRDDGAWIVTGEGCSWARVIPFGWSDLGIANGGPQARRTFLDGFVAKLYPAYASTYRRYRQVLARRNHLLQQNADRASLASRVEPWNQQLVELGLEIVRRRRDAAIVLHRELIDLYPRLGGRGDVVLEYCSGLGDAPSQESFACLLTSRLGEEIRRRQTLVGPHRDDLTIAIDGRDLRSYGSRGQQRLIALALRLSERQPVAAAVGTAPVLLLDDALSELDPGVQERVLEEVSRGGQVFLTSAEEPVPEVADAQWWEVRGGAVRDSSLVGAA